MTANDVVTVTAPDGHIIHTRCWYPEEAPTAVMVVAHGLAEHSGRYQGLAEALTRAGIAVVAADHRGHGPWTRTTGLGFVSDWDGWARLVGDLGTVVATAHNTFPHRPVFLLGHSMGSIIARCYTARHSERIAALVLTGTIGDHGSAARALLGLADALGRVRGRWNSSTLLHTVMFSRFNLPFLPARTDFDWLSRDPAEVDSYVADPLCGFVPSIALYRDLLQGVVEANSPAAFTSLRPELPVLIASGSQDPPVAKVPEVAERMRRAGVRDVTLRLYTGARHELFHETNRDEVFDDLVAWLQRFRTPTSR